MATNNFKEKLLLKSEADFLLKNSCPEFKALVKIVFVRLWILYEVLLCKVEPHRASFQVLPLIALTSFYGQVSISMVQGKVLLEYRLVTIQFTLRTHASSLFNYPIWLHFEVPLKVHHCYDRCHHRPHTCFHSYLEYVRN